MIVSVDWVSACWARSKVWDAKRNSGWVATKNFRYAQVDLFLGWVAIAQFFSFILYAFFIASSSEWGKKSFTFTRISTLRPFRKASMRISSNTSPNGVEIIFILHWNSLTKSLC